MSDYISYQIRLKDGTDLIVHADDVELDVCNNEAEGHDCPHHYYNFLKLSEDDAERNITVAAIPAELVSYIKS